MGCVIARAGVARYRRRGLAATPFTPLNDGMEGLNPYSTLGVSTDAPGYVIQAAYRACIKRFHPDHYKGSDARQKTAEILEAYRLLGTPHERARYDSEWRARDSARGADTDPPRGTGEHAPAPSQLSYSPS